MSISALNKFSAARLKAATTWPYAAPAILATSMVERPGCNGVVADKYWRLYFDPAVVDKWTQPQLVGKILLEVCHLLRLHYKRFAKQLGFDPAKTRPLPIGIEAKRKAWVQAAQLELIDDFDKESLTLPDGMPRAENFEFPENLLAEHYYARLQKPGNGGGSGGSVPPQEQQEGTGGGAPPPEFPSEGSAADGVPKAWEEPAPRDADYEDDPDDPRSDIPGLSDSESEMLRREVARRTNEHNKRQGNVPDGMRRWAEDVQQPKLDYRKIVMSKVNRALQVVRGNRDFSYKRPGRRSPQDTGVIRPSLIDHTINLVVIIDTSGSMCDKQLGEAVKIVAGILKALPRRDAVRVIAADAAVYAVQKIFTESNIALQGGGGTDMTLAIVTASKYKPKPDLILVCSDGFTDWPKEMTENVPCVAIIVSRGEKSAPAWIEQVCVPGFQVDDEETNDQ